MSADECKRKEIGEHYAQVAQTSSCCGTANSNLYDAKQIADLPPEAIKASRGCADPHAFAALQVGETVLDLGSGGGIDALLAAREVGSDGYVTGIDMTDDMLALARENANKAGLSNVDFVKGYIEDLAAAGIGDARFDVVISNCVINLSTDKPAVLREAYRVLKPGGRFVVADVVGLRCIDAGTSHRLADFLGCMSGVMVGEDYIALLEEIGFRDVSIEPINVYSTCKLRERAKRKGTQEAYGLIDEDEADGAMAGCMVIAHRSM